MQDVECDLSDGPSTPHYISYMDLPPLTVYLMYGPSTPHYISYMDLPPLTISYVYTWYISAHSVVLASCHPSLQIMQHLQLPCQMDILKQFSVETVQGLVTYLYTGNINIDLKSHSQQKNINLLCQNKAQGFRCNYKTTSCANVTVCSQSKLALLHGFISLDHVA